jgi:hypothetical protein
MCNIPIYFCNIHIKHLQHISETSKILETYIATCTFSATQHHHAASENRGSWRVEFTGDSGPAVVAARRGKETTPA